MLQREAAEIGDIGEEADELEQRQADERSRGTDQDGDDRDEEDARLGGEVAEAADFLEGKAEQAAVAAARRFVCAFFLRRILHITGRAQLIHKRSTAEPGYAPAHALQAPQAPGSPWRYHGPRHVLVLLPYRTGAADERRAHRMDLRLRAVPPPRATRPTSLVQAYRESRRTTLPGAPDRPPDWHHGLRGRLCHA